MKNFTLLRIATEEDLIEILRETGFNCHEKCPDYKSGCLRTCTHDGGREYIKEWLHEESNPEREEEIMDRAINEIKSSGLYTERPRDLINEVINENKEKLIEEMKKEGKLVTGWIPVEERLPEDDSYILLSFDNFDIPMIGRYEADSDGGGAFYLSDNNEQDTCISENLFVNAWMPLPEPYQDDIADTTQYTIGGWKRRMVDTFNKDSKN